jgi:predicted nuclease of predicted toxin-antitoxin system
MPDAASPEELLVRLYLDHHIKIQLAADLRTRGYDVVTSQEAAMDTAPDEDQLAFASNQGRTILTFNIRDFAPLHEQWTAAGRMHTGIIVSQQLGSRQYGVLLKRMLRLLNELTAEEMRGNFVHLEQFKE